MKTRIASTLLALALPLVAQEPAASQVESTFYKAFYLEKGKRDFDGAMALYSEFLAKAPEHKLAKEAAKQHFRLLDRTGKAKERDAFKEKYKDLLGKVADAPARPTRPDRADGEGRQGRGQRGDRQRGGMRGLMGLMRGDAKVAEMSEEQLAELKTGLEGSGQMIERMRQFMGDEVADKLEKSSAELKKALDKGDKAAAQTALDSLKKAFPQRGRRGGQEGGGRRGRGGDAGGRGQGGGRRGGGGGEARKGGGGGGGEAGKGGGGGN